MTFIRKPVCWSDDIKSGPTEHQSQSQRETFLSSSASGLWNNILKYHIEQESPLGSKQRTKAPNILLILADDLGYNDVPWHNPRVEAPHLLQLARAGVILEQNYVQPKCAPSRAALLTGRYPYRLVRRSHHKMCHQFYLFIVIRIFNIAPLSKGFTTKVTSQTTYVDRRKPRSFLIDILCHTFIN